MKRLALFALCFSGVVCFFGCSSATAPVEPSEEPDSDQRQPIGKTDSNGSCQASCGKKSAGTCWCDDQCAKYGDCCSDYEKSCGTGIEQGCSELAPRSVPATLAVLPDAGEAPYVSVLATAKTSIRVMVYELGTGKVLDTLKQKAVSGVKVQVILDQSKADQNKKGFDQLVEAGAQVEWSDPKFTFMHAKVLVVDGSRAVVSTGNYVSFFIPTARDYAITDSDPWDVQNLSTLFDADWQRASPALPCTRLLVSPINSKQRILTLIESATQTLIIESMQFADAEVRAAVVKRQHAGVKVRVILAAPSFVATNTAAAEFLTANEIPVRYLSSPAIHVKSIVADGLRAYAGSENLSSTSLEKNREVGMVLTEATPIASIRATFEKDWAVAVSF